METGKLNKNGENLVLENMMVVSDVMRETVPSDALYAEKGRKIVFDATPWDFAPYMGKKSGDTALIRMEFTAPEDGWYVLNCGADWWLSIWIDGAALRDVMGFAPPRVNDHHILVDLKAGKHTIDLSFTRGADSAQMALSVCKTDEVPAFGIDLEKKTGKVKKELHGSNTTLILSSRYYSKYEEALRKLNFTLARTHDWALWNPGQRLVDTHFIFPLMKLDPKDPSNYYFKPTDEIIRLTQEVAKTEVFYRLGTSIEHTGEIHFNTIPPDDFEKYAEILAGIVRHYTKGWADGFRYRIRYWEIWNEPDGGANNMWAAPYETFFPFFITVFKRLKAEFPDLMFGGPALCGTNEKIMRPLLEACKEASVFPDFISWHSYSADVDALVEEPVRVRRLLDEMGFTETKLCLNEWHYLTGWEGVQGFTTPEEYLSSHDMLMGINSGIYNTAVISGWQYGPLDSAMWYGSSWESAAWGYLDMYKQYTKNYYSMELVGRFIGKYTELCHVYSMNSVHLLAGMTADGSSAGLLVSDFKGGGTEIRIPVNGIEKYPKISAVVMDAKRNNEAVPVSVEGICLILKKAAPGSAAFLVTCEK